MAESKSLYRCSDRDRCRLHDDVVGIGATHTGDLGEGATTGDEGQGWGTLVGEELGMSHRVGGEGWFGGDAPGGLVSTPVEDHLISGNELTDLTECSLALAHPVHVACEKGDTGLSRGWGLFIPAYVMNIWGDGEFSIGCALSKDWGGDGDGGDLVGKGRVPGD